MLLDPVQVLVGPGQAVETHSAVLIKNRRLEAFGDEARRMGRSEALEPQDAGHQLLAPCLVDCHSGLPEPFHGRGETLESLVRTAGSAGFGQLALLPGTLHGQREQPDHLQGFQRSDCDVSVHLWGGFSSGSSGVELTAHGDLLEAGAVGLSDGRSMPAIALLDRALTLGEMNAAPLLIPPLDLALRGEGLLREGVNALRAGWPLDPVSSETLPLSQLGQLQQCHPDRRLVLMALSTADAVELLQQMPLRPKATVNWWHVVADSFESSATASTWFVDPSLGSRSDRKALIGGLAKDLIQAVAVQATPLDDEECLLPPDQRSRGISGHHLVLQSLWQTLVVDEGWTPEQLWQVISFGPSKLLGVKEEVLTVGSNRWLLFDPEHPWTPSRSDPMSPCCANQPLLGIELKGRVMHCGLRIPESRLC